MCFFNQTLALIRPPSRPSTQGLSCPSLQRLGLMQDRFGVVAGDPTGGDFEPGHDQPSR